MPKFGETPVNPAKTDAESLKKPSKGMVAGAAMLGAVAYTPADANENIQQPLTDPNTTEQVANNQDSMKEQGQKRAQQRAEKAQERNAESAIRQERARDLAKQLDVYSANIEDGQIVEKLSVKYIGGTPTEINGKLVPRELLTEAEIKSLDTAQKFTQTMNSPNTPDYEMSQQKQTPPTEERMESDTNKKTSNKSSKDTPIESMPINGSIY